MNDSTAWEALFPTEKIPRWILAFETDPIEALDDLIWGRFDFGLLNAAEPDDLLARWVRAFENVDGFVEQVDRSLADWIERMWGFVPSPGKISASRLATVWCRVANVVSNPPVLPKAAKSLRDHFDERVLYLGPLSIGRSRDPLGRYLLAIAQYQKDRSLEPFWWLLCDLPDSVVYYHASYGIAGIRRLPLDNSDGGFPEHVANAALNSIVALYRRTEDSSLPLSVARSEALRIARLCVSSYPILPRWRQSWGKRLTDLSPSVQQVLLAVVPSLAKPPAPMKPPRADSILLSFAQKSQVIATALKDGIGFQDAHELLDEQRRFAARGGDAHSLVQSLCNFSSQVREMEPVISLDWAREANRWEPWNPVTWTTLITALLRSGEPSEALSRALQGVIRFPHDGIIAHALGESFRRLQRYSEAELIYRTGVRRFPENEYMWSGLAETLRLQERLEEAELIYRTGVRRFPENGYMWSRLGETLKLQERLDEAEQVFRDALSHIPNHPVLTRELNQVQKQINQRYQDAKQTRDVSVGPLSSQETSDRDLDLHSDDVSMILMAKLFRRWAREPHVIENSLTVGELRSSAQVLIERVLAERPGDPRAEFEKSLLLLDAGDAQGSLDRLSDLVLRFPANPMLLFATAKAEAAQATRLQKPFNPGNAKAIQRWWEALETISPSYRPMALLGRSRSVAALVDGTAATGEVSIRLQQLRGWVKETIDRPSSTREDESFKRWWANRVSISLGWNGAQESFTDQQSLMNENSMELDLLEEEFGARLSSDELFSEHLV